MVNGRCTIKCPILSQFPARGINPDGLVFEKDENGTQVSIKLTPEEIKTQTTINDKYNKRVEQLADILTSKLKDVDVTWCNDGCFVISCSNTLLEMENIIADEKLEIQLDRTEIKHKIKTLEDGTTAEDIDFIFEQDDNKQKNKLKCIDCVNKCNI